MNSGFPVNYFNFNRLFGSRPDRGWFDSILAASRELAGIQGRACARVLSIQTELAGSWLEQSRQQPEFPTTLAGMEAYRNRQVHLYQEYCARLAEAAEQTLQIMEETGDAWREWLVRNATAPWGWIGDGVQAFGTGAPAADGGGSRS